MNTIAPNPLNAHLFEIPDPPEEFGQDGGKFYRCYDKFADELDDDMVNGLKEQLDGMLVFAGLFAGVNTAFLALTLPLLSASPSDDTNALLAQNNALLFQLVTGRNDSVPTKSPLPSAGFSPSSDIFVINALFALSLAFAIISSFLAVLGRQWLVYYRKRSGGGPDRQRWEQLRRFLGAERWRLETILDDVLPSLLQVGLIIFCVSLIIYLRLLSPAISVIVGIPMYVGLAVFIGSALCTLWDKFCPFHSPLSHMLLAVRNAMSPRAIKGFKWRNLIPAMTIKQWFQALIHGRGEENPESLKIIALQRAICTSDDPATLLHATANILGITKVIQMERLWGDEAFRERFLDQLQSSYTRVLQLRGRDQVGIAVAARRLYCGAAAHIMLVLDSGRGNSRGTTEVQVAKEIIIPNPFQKLFESSTYLVRATLRFPLNQCDRIHSSDETAKDIHDHLAAYPEKSTHPDWRLFSVITWVASNLRTIQNLNQTSVESGRLAFRGDVEGMIQILGIAFTVLAGPESRELVDCDGILIKILHGIRQIIIVNHKQLGIKLPQQFALLEICEPILQSPRPEAVRKIIKGIRLDLAQALQREFTHRATHNGIPTHLIDTLEGYLEELQIFCQADSGYDECIEVLRAFSPPIRQLYSSPPDKWASTSGWKKRIEFRDKFNTFVLEVDKRSRQIQKNPLIVRDPDERWCHWKLEGPSISSIFSLPIDSPGSVWHRVSQSIQDA